jgi:hypothetical protein
MKAVTSRQTGTDRLAVAGTKRQACRQPTGRQEQGRRQERQAGRGRIAVAGSHKEAGRQAG